MSHYRFCPISGKCVIVSAKRKRRPNDFAYSGFENENIDSPFVHGNEHKTPKEIFSIRHDGSRPDTPGWHVRVVPNKYNALDIEKEHKKIRLGIYDSMDGFGAHEVVIDTPRFPSSAYDFTELESFMFLSAIAARAKDLGSDQRLKYILPFKNNGPFSGATLAHPHTQIMALPFLPHSIEHELIRCKRYYAEHSRSLLEDITQEETLVKSRIVKQSENFLAFCPFASSEPFSVMIMPLSQKNIFCTLSKPLMEELAELLNTVVKKIGKATNNASFNVLFRLVPPVRDDEKDLNIYHLIDEYHGWRIEILPRLSFDGGFEQGTGIRINPVCPEESAEFLRKSK